MIAWRSARLYGGVRFAHGGHTIPDRIVTHANSARTFDFGVHIQNAAIENLLLVVFSTSYDSRARVVGNIERTLVMRLASVTMK